MWQHQTIKKKIANNANNASIQKRHI